MKGKKVLKILVAAVMAVTFIAQVVAMADTTDYNTMTEYDVTSGKARVTTSVSGVNSGDEVTFLVQKGQNILYIDQTSETQGTASFTFLTPVGNADGTPTVAVGTSTAGRITPSTTNTITLSQGTVTYTVGEHGAVFVSDGAYSASGSQSAYPNENIVFYIAPDTGYEFYSYAINGGEADISQRGYNTFTYKVSGNATIAFAFIEKDASSSVTAQIETEPSGVTGYEATTNNGTIAENAMTSFATISNKEAAVEYGIVVSKSSGAINAIDSTNIGELTSVISNIEDTAAVYKFPALGALNGAFGVKLVNGEKAYLTGTVYSKTYVKSADGSVHFGAIVEHTY